MNKRRIFTHVLASDLQIADVAMIEQPGYEQGSVCRCLLTLTDISTKWGKIQVEGQTEFGYTQMHLLSDPNLLVAVVCNG